MPKNCIVINIAKDGLTLKENVLDFYSLKISEVPYEKSEAGKNIPFRWSNIVDFFDENKVQINRKNIAKANSKSKVFDNTLDSLYSINELSVTENTLVSKGTTIYISEYVNDLFFQTRKNKIYSRFDNINYQNVKSKLFSDYMLKVIKDNNRRPYYSPKDFTYEGNILNGVNVSIVSARVFVVSKSKKNRVLNVSPYLIDCNWNDTDNGGNFSFVVASPTAMVKNGTWEKNAHTEVKNAFNELQYFHQDSLNSYRVLNREYSNQPINSFKRMYFDLVLQKYDVVFIRGEKLFTEEDETDIDKLWECDISDLVNKNWDCIGLIDNINTNYVLQNGMVGMQISGRDLMALPIEDQTVILPNLAVANESGTIYEQYLSNFIANPNEMKRSKAYERMFGTIQDLSLIQAQPVGRMIEWIFDKMQNSPFCTDYKLFKEFKFENPYISFDETNWNEIQKGGKYERLGVWNTVCVWIDESVKNRFVFDSSIGSSGGNMLSFITKIAMPPLVQFLTCTIGSFFHWIIRKPPYDRNDYKALFNTCNIENSHVIRADQVLGMQLEWDSSQIYSVYRFVPTYSIASPQNKDYLYPAIAIPELMDRFGCKVGEFTSNYLDTNDLIKSFEQSTMDLQWLIETNIYKPFSQKGVISIIGDRIIKKGQAIYYEPLDLLCYVTGVSNQFSISESGVNRVTILTVERCIRYKHYDLYYNICDFGGFTTSNYNNPKKNVSLRKNGKGEPYIWNFFEQRLELDYDNDYQEIYTTLRGQIGNLDINIIGFDNLA